MQDRAMFSRLKALIIFRAFFVALLLGTSLIFNIGYQKFPYPHAILYMMIALYLISIIYSILLYRVSNLAAFAYVQLAIDAVSEILLIFFTGGIESWFSSLMLLTVLAAAIMINKRAGYIIATICGIFYGLIMDLQYYGIIPVSYSSAVSAKDFLYNIFSHISALYLTAYLAGYLSARLERTSIKLEEKDMDLMDLSVFNRDLIENLPSGLLTADLAGGILIFNRAAEGITGIGRERAHGQNIVDIFPFMQRLTGTERCEGAIRTATDSRIIGVSMSATSDSKGQKAGYICVFQDITGIKKLEAEVKQHETLSAIGAISANMAHEIRNPLASLKGSIELMREGMLSREHSNKLMDIAISEMDRLNKIITDFLAYSRPGQPEFIWFDLGKMLGDTAELIRNAAMTAGNISIKEDIPCRIDIFADPHKLRQVFLNLGKNAIEAMPDGGELKIAAFKDDAKVRVSFTDSGKGIRTENLKEIFYPFFSTKEKGTGLGLPIAYRIIEEHNGRINVSTKNGQGTVFEVTLPLIPYNSQVTYGEAENRAGVNKYVRR